MFSSVFTSFFLATLSLLPAGSGAVALNGVRCTYHDYEGLWDSLGPASDTAPGWCGIRYSGLDIKHIVAVNGMNTAMCNKCLKVTGDKSVYVLAVDLKTSSGLDLSKTAFQEAFPGKNPLDPKVCSWEVVNSCYCTGLCWDSVQICSVGHRNLLPYYLLPPVDVSLKSARGCQVTSAAKTSSRTAVASATLTRRSSRTSVPASSSRALSSTRTRRTRTSTSSRKTRTSSRKSLTTRTSSTRRKSSTRTRTKTTMT